MEYQSYINELKIKGKEEGITRYDYKKLLHHYRQINNEICRENISKQVLDELKKVLKEFDDLIYLLGDDFRKQIDDKNIEYVMANSLISGIVFANSENPIIKPYSIDSYMYLCNFHDEKTPSLGVSDDVNLFYCFGCGISGNIFKYLMEYEKLSFIESVYLLAAINGVKFPNNKYDINNELVIKYRSALTSVEYLNVLKKALDRNVKRNMKQIYNQLNFENQSIEDYYNRKFEFIERIKNGKIDDKFIYVPICKKIFLEIEEAKKIIIPKYVEESVNNNPIKKLVKEIPSHYNPEYDLPF